MAMGVQKKNYCNFTTSICVCLCVCVSVCLFILFHCKAFFRLQLCLRHAWVKGSMILCCGHDTRCFCQVRSSQFLNLSYFTSRDETPAHIKPDSKWNDIGYDICYGAAQVCMKEYLLDLDYKSVQVKTDE